MKKFYLMYYTLFTLGFFLFLIGVYAMLISYSPNQAEKKGSFFPRVQAELRFFQNAGYNLNYTKSGADFIASPEYYNNSYNKVGVNFAGEPTPPFVDPTFNILNITRESH